MADTPKADPRVAAALKASIATNLAREKAITKAVGGGLPSGAAHFSNGVIFSKSGNGTPFSNGVFFSKTGALELGIDPAEQEIVQQMVGMDEAAFGAFTERLLRLKQAKAQGR